MHQVYKNVVNFIRRLDLLLFLGILFCEFSIFHLFFYTRYNADTYTVQTNQMAAIAQHSSQGRLGFTFVDKIFEWLGLNTVTNQFIEEFISILCIVIATYLLTKLCLKITKQPKESSTLAKINRIGLVASVLLITSNIYVADMMSFPEVSAGFGLSLLFLVLSLTIFVNARQFKNYILSGFLLLISVFFYQTWSALFFPLCLVFIFIKKSDKWQKLREILYSGGIYTFAVAGDIFYIKYIHPLLFDYVDQRAALGNIANNFRVILKSQENVWVNSFSLIGKYIFLVIIVLGILSFVLTRIRERNWWKVVIFPAICGSIMVLGFLPHLFTSDIWITPRSIVAIGALPGVILLTYYLLKPKQSLKILEGFVFIISVLFLFLTLTTINKIASDQSTTNELDRGEFVSLYKQITEYEMSHAPIKQILYKLDKTPHWCHSNLMCTPGNARALTQTWAIKPLFKIVSKRDFIVNQMSDADYKKYFADENFGDFDPDSQIKFNNDRAYIAIN
jgi:hypothetical protein